MSSESSVSTGDSSRLRQFGLYRTIDARTEEFLRQSKKRQIKQGCACATISTVITVTVVITVIVVYMKNGPSKDSNKTFSKASWIGLINDSISLPFEEKLRKSKFDRSTIKLLPLLLEALKQNIYLEKILEDYSSSSMPYDGKATTEYTLEKNVFADAKTWIKNPTSRMYAIEYKAAPLAYFKKPTGKLAYISKLRKIRDYKKIFRNVEKTMSDNKIQETAITADKLNSKTTIPPKVVKIIEKKSKSKKITSLSKDQRKTVDSNNIVSCNCPGAELNILLSKLISSIQNYLPNEIKSYKENIKSSTETGFKITTDINKAVIKKDNSLPFHMSEFNNVFRKQASKDLIDKNALNKDELPMLSLNPKLNNDIIESGLNGANSKESNLEVTDVKKSVEPTEISIPHFTTKQMVPDLNQLSKNGLLRIGYSNRSISRQNENTSNTKDDDLTHLKDRKDETTTLEPIANAIIDFGIHSLELIKSKLLPTNRHSNKAESLINNELLPSYSQVHQPEEARFHAPSVLQEDLGSKSSTEPMSFYQITPNKNKDLKSITHVVKSTLEPKKQQSRSEHFKNAVKGYEEAKVTNYDYHEEFHEKSTESMTSLSVSLLNKTVVGVGLNPKKQNEDFWSFLNINYDRSKMKSMLPINRPTYLEIQRNNLKVEDNVDYDLNMKYNVFDLL